MKAAIRRNCGNPEAITIENIETPIPKADEILVRVRATTVNRTDCAILTGKPYVMRLFVGLTKPKSPLLGTDFAGEVVEIGSAVQSFKVSDKVWGFKDEGLFSQAEYVVVKEKSNVAVFPDNLTFQQAAACLEGVHYAYNFMDKVNIKSGQKILVNGATGAIGSATLQILKYKKIDVTAVCNTKNIDLIKSLGADKIIDYLKEDFTEDDEKYDFILDSVGKSTFGKCKHLLKKGGIYISSELGPNAQNIFFALTTPLLGNKKVVFPLPSNIKRSMSFIADLVKKEKFKPVIDREYPLEEIADAYRYVFTGEKTGNVILSMQ